MQLPVASGGKKSRLTLSAGLPAVRHQCMGEPVGAAPRSKPEKMRGPNMNTILLTTQMVCYGVGIVSASLNIVSSVRRWRAVTDEAQDAQ